MNHTRFETTEKKAANLRKLASYLLSLPEGYEEFQMGHFCGGSYYSGHGDLSPKESVKAVGCGTSACALGHAPSAGIGRYSKLEYWQDFSANYLIDSNLNVLNDRAWNWCFSGEWEDKDNTPQGAGLRINYLLDRGLPENWSDQLLSEDEPLSYKDE